ncbi:MAG: hypothetical protein HC861_03920 [Rhodospirillaceae bacterium]|nr:hypothetical protein [Rhodospirillaceae bacterium]
MTTFGHRRLRSWAITGMVAGLLVAVELLYDMSLRDAAFLNGWLLFAGMVLLAIFNLRKKLNILPLMRMSTWLQLHIYTGMVCLLLFLLHTSFSLPNGPFETTLWVLYMTITVSGLVGVALSRLLPHRISARGERVIFERIPVLRAQIARDIEQLAMTSVQETRASTIADFYIAELAPYLQRPKHLMSHLLGGNRPERRLHVAIRELERYLDERGRQILGEIDSLVSAKADLDYQYAIQFTLKGWLFFHLPLNYGLMLFSLVHIVLVYAFATAAP